MSAPCYLESLTGFAEAVSPLVGGRWVAWPYLRYLCSRLEEELRKPDARVIINWPPRHGKSLCVSQWLPVWYLENRPRRRVLLASYEHSVAARWGRSVRDIFSHPLLRTKVRPDVSAADNWETTEGGGVRCAGVGGPLTGIGGHLALVDDPVKNSEQAESPTYRENAKEWYLSTFRTRVEPGGAIVVNQTRWHEDDLTGWLLRESSEDWTHICLPALAEAGDALGRAEGEALCPERFSVEALQRISTAVGSRVWAGMYQQRPLPAEGSIIKPQWIRHYDRLPDRVAPVGLSVDASFKETRAGSFVVLQAWGQCGADSYLLDQVRERMDFSSTLKALKGMIARWPRARARWIEDKANGSAIISTLRKEVPGLIAVEPQGSKESRLQAVSPLFEAGNVHVPDAKAAPWVVDWVAEVTSFPSAPNDDQVDATSQALLKLSARRRAAGGGFGATVPH